MRCASRLQLPARSIIPGQKHRGFLPLFFREQRNACTVADQKYRVPQYKIFQMELVNYFSKDIEHVRISAFGQRYEGSLREAVDDKCSHLVIRDDQKVVATLRISSASDSILQHWFENKLAYAASSSIGELTRGAVLPEYRGFGLYQLMLMEALVSYPELNFDRAICAARLGLKQLPFLYQLGFSDFGCVQPLASKNGIVMLQPLKLDVMEHLAVIHEFRQLHTINMRNKGIEVTTTSIANKVAKL